MRFTEAVFGFMREPVRQDIGSNHRTTGILLKVMCWITFVVATLVAIASVVIGFVTLFGAAFWTRYVADQGGPDWIADLGAMAGAIGFLILLFAGALAVTVMGLYLWWNNRTYQQWNQHMEGALTMTNVFAGVTLGMSLLGIGDMRLFSFDDGTTSSSLFELQGGNFLSIILAILVLVFANLAHSQGELQAAAAPTTPDQPVD